MPYNLGAAASGGAGSSGLPSFLTSGNDISKFLKMSGAGGIASGLFGLFGGGDDPYDEASKYFNQIPGESKKYLEPYINTGMDAMGDLKKRYASMLNDPGSILAQLGKGYQSSPGFEFEKSQGLNAANNAAAAGGMLGTSQHQQQAGDLATQLANRDFGDYLKNAMGMYNRGLEGEEGFNTQGFNASNNLAQMISEALMNQGNLAYSGAASKNASQSQMLGDIIGAAGLFL